MPRRTPAPSMDAPTRELIQTLGQMLDGLHTAMCLFDTEDRALVWNRSFFQFFPEHDGHLHEGEPYRDNLRRFYQARLGAAEQARIDSYIEAGIARHHDQTQPYEFEHRGLRLLVSSLPLEGLGRMRLWRAEKPQPTALADAAAPPAALLERVPNGLMVSTPDGRITWVNAPFAQMYGLRNPAAALGATFEEVYRAAWGDPPESAASPCAEGLKTLHENLRFTGAPFELPLPGKRFCRVMARPTGDGARFYAHIDISELKLQQQQLARAERAARESAALLERKSTLLQATLESMEQGFAMINTEGVVELYNRRILELLDLPRELLDRRPTLHEVIHYQRAQGEFEGLPENIQNYLESDTQAYALRTLERRRPNGGYLEVRNVPVQGGGMLRTFTDITERKRHEQRIEHMASHDGLTGLINRGKFMEYLAAEVALARRMQTCFAVLYLDLDGFKPINDRHGHAMGDKVLAWVAQILRQEARASDFTARLGGDEFAVLQRGIVQHAQALRLVERLAQVLSKPFVLDGLSLRIGVSIGMALYPEHGADPETLMVFADQSMYIAKAGQRSDSSLGFTAPR